MVGALFPIPGLPRSREETIYDDRATSDNWESGHLEDQRNLSLLTELESPPTSTTTAIEA